MRSSILDPTPKDAHDCRTAPSRTARAMSEWTEIKARFERPLGALAVCVLLLLFFSGLFYNAKIAYLPANPATLHAVTVRVDKVAECPYSHSSGKRQNSGYTPGCYVSDDYPGVAFEKSGGVAGLDIPLPQRLELLINREPDDLKNFYEGKMFSVYVPINVYGVRQQDGKVLVDPGPLYDKYWAQKQRRKAYAWIVVLIGLGFGGYAFVKIRKILRDPYL